MIRGDRVFTIGEVAIDDMVGKATFCCDLQHCGGACCCIEGGRGAPLEDDEALEMERAYPLAKRYLSTRSVHVIESQGMFEGQRGSFATTCIDQKECAFAFVENNIARCSFERAFEEGLTNWRKPISCHLFPIRIRNFGTQHLRYEEIDECHAGRIKGGQQNVQLHDFLKEPLTRKYGEAWYREFIAYCTSKGTHAGPVADPR